MSGLTQKLVEDFQTAEPNYGGIFLEVGMAQLMSINNLDKFLQPQKCSNVNFAVNMLTKIEPIFLKLTNLRILDLSINHISEITNLESCGQLVELNLSKNQIGSIANLENLKSLKVLNLSMNKIRKMAGLQCLTQLENLILYGNQIEHLEGLDNNNKLRELLINRNKLRSLNYLTLPDFWQLSKVNASHNNIPASELENVAHVTMSLLQLSELNLYGNEVYNDPSYKFRLTESSSLEKLDGLDVKGVVKERLYGLRREWKMDQLISETSEEALQWIEAEREIKQVAKNILANKQDRLANDFDKYRNSVESDVQNFIRYVTNLKLQTDRGEGNEITFDKLNNWKSKIQVQEQQRIQMLEEQLQRIEQQRMQEMNKAVNHTNFLDKLYEVSMKMPDAWGEMKTEEYHNAQIEGKSRHSNNGSYYKPQSRDISEQIRSSQRNLEGLTKLGQKQLGTRLRQDINDEMDQAKQDFEEQRRAEEAAEKRYQR